VAALNPELNQLAGYSPLDASHQALIQSGIESCQPFGHHFPLVIVTVLARLEAAIVQDS
jgi:hypothetical protein